MLNYEKYRHHLQGRNLPAAEENALMDIVWELLEHEVDCAFGLYTGRINGGYVAFDALQSHDGSIGSNLTPDQYTSQMLH